MLPRQPVMGIHSDDDDDDDQGARAHGSAAARAAPSAPSAASSARATARAGAAPEAGRLVDAWALVRAYHSESGLTPGQEAQVDTALNTCRATSPQLLAHRSW